MLDEAKEVNFDGLIAPFHNYGGLSSGNKASVLNSKKKSSPKKAVLQGLEKMIFLSRKGMIQGLIPPILRPIEKTLYNLGYKGKGKLTKVYRDAPAIFYSLFSASSMWTANAATVSPSADSSDRKVHFTAANLSNKFHRHLESQETSKILKRIFGDERYFVHHETLLNGENFGDEGAANHTRFCTQYGEKGLQLFSYGKASFDPKGIKPQVFPARQALEASKAIARLHKLESQNTLFAQTSTYAIDRGVFHNDVISVGNKDIFFHHEKTFENKNHIKELKEKFFALTGNSLRCIEVKEAQVSLDDAVKSYLFNSQLISFSDGNNALILPSECGEIPSIREYLDTLDRNLIQESHIFDLRQSMRNGGGPACLRLRVVLTEEERKATFPGIFINEYLYEKLKIWANKHYRDELTPEEMLEPMFLTSIYEALDELSIILDLPHLYDFQQTF
ncbi:MAG: N-succinylarginine dihydrolase [Bdellovibrionota bacterium]|nr:N-succinylarginine dihydrolase [Bdellovibrionota bacterium]